MRSLSSKSLLLAVAGGASVVVAHGFVDQLIINGVMWPGWDVNTDAYQDKPPVKVGWATYNKDTGPVSYNDMGKPDIICGKDAKNAQGYATVAAGDSVYIPWGSNNKKWPVGHSGPITDYLAPCGAEGCEKVDKTTLKFFKIDEFGMTDPSPVAGQPAIFGTEIMMKQSDDGWLVQIPPNIAPGNYVLRHELVALHDVGKPQPYPQCFNLHITGTGTDAPEGVLGTQISKLDDPGNAFNVYDPKNKDYVIPGPPLISGAAKSIEQKQSVATSTAKVTAGAPAGDGNAAGGGGATATGGAASKTTGKTTKTSAAASAVSTTAKMSSAAPAGTGSTPANTGRPAVDHMARRRSHARDVLGE